MQDKDYNIDKKKINHRGTNMCSTMNIFKTFCSIILMVISISSIFANNHQTYETKIISNAVTIGSDNKIMKRTPSIDGIITPCEWDIFYEYENNKLYVNWDNSNLYIGGQINNNLASIVVIDIENNGWFHGEENYEFIISEQLIARRYISPKGSIGEPTILNESEIDLINYKINSLDQNHFEISISSRLLRKLDLRTGKKIGFNIILVEKNNISRYERNTLESEFVDKKVAALNPIEIKIELRDKIIAKGEELQGKFSIKNNGSNPIPIDSVIMSGEGRAAPLMNSQKIILESIEPGKTWSRNYSSIIPATMPNATWVIGAEARHNSNRLGGAMIAFDVVDPYDISLILPKVPIEINTKEIEISIQIRNNTKGSIRGKTILTLPLGWEIHKSNPEREFRISRRSVAETKYKVVPPLGAIGNIPVNAKVIIGNYEEELDGNFEMSEPLSQ
ncbi:MAG: hypothetical protein SNJ70_01420 [Armatimonadota bacterium]